MTVDSKVIQPPALIFTDLDGTLLDYSSYQWDRAKPALDLCQRFHVPVVLVSSKTRAEMERLRNEMGLSSPFISENGGGIFFPKEFSGNTPPNAAAVDNIYRWSLGVSYESLVRSLQEMRDKLGIYIRGFSDMTADEISDITGLDPESARLAAIREYDEPFIFPVNDSIDLVHEWAKKKGLHISEGGRFYHLHGKNDKGYAVKKLISWYKESYSDFFTLALGDSPNDFSMLMEVDLPVLVRSSRSFPGIEKEIPGVKITNEIGPEGWNSIIMDYLTKKIDGGVS